MQYLIIWESALLMIRHLATATTVVTAEIAKGNCNWSPEKDLSIANNDIRHGVKTPARIRQIFFRLLF